MYLVARVINMIKNLERSCFIREIYFHNRRYNKSLCGPSDDPVQKYLSLGNCCHWRQLPGAVAEGMFRL